MNNSTVSSNDAKGPVSEDTEMAPIDHAMLDFDRENKLLANQVKKAADLAAIAITPKGLMQMTDDVIKILKLTQQLNQVDTTNIKPMAHPLELHHHHNSLRSDKITDSQTIQERDKLQQLAPESAAGFYCVPTFIEEQSDEDITD